MGLGTLLLATGFGAVFRAPSRAGTRVSGRSLFGTNSGSQVRRGPRLIFVGVLVAACGACVTYGPMTVYQTVDQTISRFFT